MTGAQGMVSGELWQSLQLSRACNPTSSSFFALPVTNVMLSLAEDAIVRPLASGMASGISRPSAARRVNRDAVVTVRWQSARRRRDGMVRRQFIYSQPTHGRQSAGMMNSVQLRLQAIAALTRETYQHALERAKDLDEAPELALPPHPAKPSLPHASVSRTETPDDVVGRIISTRSSAHPNLASTWMPTTLQTASTATEPAGIDPDELSGLEAPVHEVADDLDRRLKKRPSVEDLKAKGILPNASGVSPTLLGSMLSLEKQRKSDGLERQLQKRPSVEELTGKGIMAEGALTSPLVSGAKVQLQRRATEDAIQRGISSRPEPETLVRRGILQALDVAAQP